MSTNPDTMTDEEFSRFMTDTIAEGGIVEEEEAVVDAVEEEESEELEQPEDKVSTEDSDNEADDEIDEYTEDEDSDDQEDDQPDDVEEEPEEEVDETVKAEATIRTHRVKADGDEFEFTDEELIALAPKAMNYTKKMQEIAPYRKRISAMKDNNITEDDFNLMMDVFKGNKDAISTILKRTGTDALDLDDSEDINYTPTSYGKDESTLAIEEIDNVISKDPEYNVTKRVIDEDWDNSSRTEFRDNPKLIEALHYDVKHGIYNQVAPLARKLKALDDGTKSDITYYRQAGAQMREKQELLAKQDVEAKKNATTQEAVAKVKTKQAKQAEIKSSSNKRKSAATTKSKAGKRDVLDYLDADKMSDEDFTKFMEKQIKKG